MNKIKIVEKKKFYIKTLPKPIFIKKQNEL